MVWLQVLVYQIDWRFEDGHPSRCSLLVCVISMGVFVVKCYIDFVLHSTTYPKWQLRADGWRDLKD